MTTSAVLLLACTDRPGIVSRVSTHLAAQGANILRAEQSESVADARFYQRIHFDHASRSIDLDAFREGFGPVAEELGAEWSVHAMDEPQTDRHSRVETCPLPAGPAGPMAGR